MNVPIVFPIAHTSDLVIHHYWDITSWEFSGLLANLVRSHNNQFDDFLLQHTKVKKGQKLT